MKMFARKMAINNNIDPYRRIEEKLIKFSKANNIFMIKKEKEGKTCNMILY